MGYVEVETRDTCPLFPPGLTARGHVFHFSQILEEKIVGGFGPLASPTGYKMCYSATMQVPHPLPQSVLLPVSRVGQQRASCDYSLLIGPQGIALSEIEASNTTEDN